MKLKDLINKMKPNSYCYITISTLCDEYCGGSEEIKKEEWYKKNRDRKVVGFNIITSGHDIPEIYIIIE